MNDEHQQPGSSPPGSPPDPPNFNLRRRMVEEAFKSKKLRNAIEIILRHAQGGTDDWNELMDEVNDIVGEVATIALSCLDNFDPNRAGALSWLIGIAINVIRNRNRWKRRDQKFFRPQSTFSEEKWRQVLEQLSVDHRPSKLSREDCVWCAMEMLDPQEQYLLRLRFILGMNYDQMAAVFNTSKQTMRKRVSRALQSLRKSIEAQQRRKKS